LGKKIIKIKHFVPHEKEAVKENKYKKKGLLGLEPMFARSSKENLTTELFLFIFQVLTFTSI